MKKIFIIIFLPLIPYASFCQALIINGELIDKEQNKYIPYVHLAILGTSIGTTSNSEGKFSIAVPEKYLKDSLVFSCVGYETLKIPIDELLFNYQKLYLKKATITLNQVVVTSLSAKEIIRKSIKRIPENYTSSPIIIQGYYLSATKEGEKFARLLESSLSLYNKNPSLTNDYILLNHNSIKKSDDYRTYIIKEPRMITEALFFDHVSNRKGFLNVENLDSWTFEVAGIFKDNKNNTLIIQANYITDTTKMEHTAKIYLNSDDYAILKVQYTYNWNSRNFKISAGDSITTDYRKWTGAFYYARNNSNKYFLRSFNFNKYFLRSFNFKVAQGIYDKVTGNLITVQEINNEFIISKVKEISKAEANRLPKLDQKNIDLNERDWNLKKYSFDYPIKSTLYKQIIKDIEGYK